jgi:hypothetical protein
VITFPRDIGQFDLQLCFVRLNVSLSLSIDRSIDRGLEAERILVEQGLIILFFRPIHRTIIASNQIPKIKKNLGGGLYGWTVAVIVAAFLLLCIISLVVVGCLLKARFRCACFFLSLVVFAITVLSLISRAQRFIVDPIEKEVGGSAFM